MIELYVTSLTQKTDLAKVEVRYFGNWVNKLRPLLCSERSNRTKVTN